MPIHLYKQIIEIHLCALALQNLQCMDLKCECNIHVHVDTIYTYILHTYIFNISGFIYQRRPFHQNGRFSRLNSTLLKQAVKCVLIFFFVLFASTVLKLELKYRIIQLQCLTFYSFVIGYKKKTLRQQYNTSFIT